MQTRRGEILQHGEEVEPHLGSTRQTIRARVIARRGRPRHFHGPLKHRHPRGCVVATPAPTARGAVAKSWQTSASTTAKHLSYLTQTGKGGEHRKAPLFTAEGRLFERKAFVREVRDDPFQHRLILSIPDHAQVSLPQLTRAFMRHIERDVLHAEVAWVASEHRDHPEHPHVHVVMRGVDATGCEVHFTHDYRLRSMRYAVQRLLTQWLGETPSPVDTTALDAWATAHMQEAKAMRDRPMAPEEEQPYRPNLFTPQEAQRRLEATRQRMQSMIARLHTGYGQTPLQGMTPDEAQSRIETLKARLVKDTQQSRDPEDHDVQRDRVPDGSMGMDV